MQLRAGMGRRGSGGLRGLFSEKGWECLCVMLVSVVELWAVDKTHDCWRGYTAGCWDVDIVGLACELAGAAWSLVGLPWGLGGGHSAGNG